MAKVLPTLLCGLVVTVVCAGTVHTQTPQLRAKPAEISGPYKTEYLWAVTESSLDIAEMAAFAASKPRPATVTPPAGAVPWNPESFKRFAETQFAAATQKPDASFLPAYPVLTDLTAESLVTASDRVSQALKTNMRSAQAHEAAALVLVAFGLREAADDMSDVRWVLNRATAHLAVAAALRGATMPSVDGQLARIVLLALSGRRQSAMVSESQLTSKVKDAPFDAWRRAIRIRLQQDWRNLPQPRRASRLEKLEYFRARLATLDLRASADLTRIGEEPAADFIRIIHCFDWGIEDGDEFVRPAMEFELNEFAQVFKSVQKRSLPDAPVIPPDIINARGGRLMTDGTPQVIPWGAWAEFFNRHLTMEIAELDQLFRRMYGQPKRADEVKAALDPQFRHLTLFPIASMKRRVTTGVDADETYLPQAVALAARAPELVNYDFWAFIEPISTDSPLRESMPRRASFFAPPTPQVSYEAGIRGRDSAAAMTTPALVALLKESVYDTALMRAAYVPRPNNQGITDVVEAQKRARIDYDVKVILAAYSDARDNTERLDLLRRACAISVQQCVSWGLLLTATDEAAAARVFQDAFKDSALDAVYKANNSRWLVRYFERHNQLEQARALATEAGQAYSHTGLVTLAGFQERHGQIKEAEETLLADAKRYPPAESTQLIGFYYRQAITGKNPAYQQRYETFLRSAFPRGLQPVPTTMPSGAIRGVAVTRDTWESGQAGLRGGDVVVGVDGWLVENKRQYQAVAAFQDEDTKRKITVWRGQLVTVDAFASIRMDLADRVLR